MSRKKSNSDMNDAMLKLFDKFKKTHGISGPSNLWDAATWMVRSREYTPAPIRLIAQCRRQLAIALGSKRRTDAQGRRVKAMHAAKYPRMDKSGQLRFETMWDDGETMIADHAHVSFTQRWYQIAGECRSLKRDMDSWNDNNPNAVGHEIQKSFNFDLEIEDTSDAMVEVFEESSNSSDRRQPPKLNVAARVTPVRDEEPKSR